MRTRFLLFPLLLFAACRTAPPPTSATRAKKNVPPPTRLYRASYPLVDDLGHTSLEIRPDWKTQTLAGKATLTLSPHFYPVDSLVLNARGMLVHRVALLQGADTIPLSHDYDGLLLHIRLNKVY